VSGSERSRVDGVDWIYLAQDMWWAVVNTVMDLSV